MPSDILGRVGLGTGRAWAWGAGVGVGVGGTSGVAVGGGSDAMGVGVGGVAVGRSSDVCGVGVVGAAVGDRSVGVGTYSRLGGGVGPAGVGEADGDDQGEAYRPSPAESIEESAFLCRRHGNVHKIQRHRAQKGMAVLVGESDWQTIRLFSA